MKKIMHMMFALLFVSCLSASGKMEEDKYVGMTIKQVIKELGATDFSGEQVIDSNYLPTPTEPYYPNYFTEAELKESVVINVTRWVKGRENIIVWAKMIKDEWIVFSSLKYSKSAFIKY